jgi:hypothetical protein
MSPDQKERDDFGQLVDLLLMASPNGIVAMLNAYVDAGTQGDVLTVAITAFGGEGAKKANRKWIRLWGDTICHMTDLHAKKEDFLGWGEKKAGEMLTKSIAIVNAHGVYCVAVSCSVNEYSSLAPTSAIDDRADYLDMVRRPYAFCSHMAMLTLAEISGGEGKPLDIYYWVESGDRHQGELKRFINFMDDVPILKKLYRMAGHTIIDKSKARLLETSDILAWEWTRHRIRTPDDEHIRKSFAVLMGVDEPPKLRGVRLIKTQSRYAIQYSGESFQRHMKWFRDWLSGHVSPTEAEAEAAAILNEYGSPNSAAQSPS